MIKKSILFAAAIALVCTFAVGYGVSTAADAGPEEMVLKTGDGKKPAKFPHKAHQDKFACGECHHTKGDDGKQVPYTEGMEIQKCASCHNDDMANPKLNSFKNVSHINCKDCHQEKGGNAPTKCAGCHVAGL